MKPEIVLKPEFVEFIPEELIAKKGEENEAEKLFRGMEQKVRTAKTLQLRFELSITDADGKKGNAKGTLILGEGDKYRAEAEGKLFGEAVIKFTSVSDGSSVKSFGVSVPKEGKPEKSAKGAGASFRETLPREGFFLSTLEMDRRGGRAPDLCQMSDFKLAGKEKIGGRNTRVIQYTVTVTVKDYKDPLSMKMKMWLDAETNLPVKLAMTGAKSDLTDVTDVTETYSEFTVNAKVRPVS
jgi:outer membrane lipoprotein-sorting protein